MPQVSHYFALEKWLTSYSYKKRGRQSPSRSKREVGRFPVVWCSLSPPLSDYLCPSSPLDTVGFRSIQLSNVHRPQLTGNLEEVAGVVHRHDLDLLPSLLNVDQALRVEVRRHRTG